MSEKKQEFLVEGFLFHDEEMAEKARREAAGIKYIRSKTSMDSPGMVLQVYEKIIEQQLFETPVGIGYLRELQEYLLTIPAIRNEDVKPIPVEEIIKQEYVPLKEVEQKEQKKKEKSGRKADRRFWISVAANVILALMVAAMFAITLTSQHPNILNYEEKLLDKYAGWEEELKGREQQIREKEKKLGIEP